MVIKDLLIARWNHFLKREKSRIWTQVGLNPDLQIASQSHGAASHSTPPKANTQFLHFHKLQITLSRRYLHCNLGDISWIKLSRSEEIGHNLAL